MFLPAKHPTITKIKKTQITGSGETAPLYNFRDRVIEAINSMISEIEDKSTLDEDLEVICQWFELKSSAEFWRGFKKEYYQPTEAAEYILETAFTDVQEAQASQSFQKAAGVPSESDLEDAINAVDAIAWIGSEKQIKWASDIAQKSVEKIASAWKKAEFDLPAQAKWWIKNRENIYVALIDLK